MFMGSPYLPNPKCSMACKQDRESVFGNLISLVKSYFKNLIFLCDLIFKGRNQPSGYTEPLLHLNRLKKKINQN